MEEKTYTWKCGKTLISGQSREELQACIIGQVMTAVPLNENTTPDPVSFFWNSETELECQ